MAVQRIVVGSTRGGDLARRAARMLRDAGQEIVFVGGGQSPEQLVRTAIAEDARDIVVDAEDVELSRMRELLVALDADDVTVRLADESSSDLRSPR